MWGLVLKVCNFIIILSNRKEARLHLVCAWVEQNDSATCSNVHLTCANIDRFLVLPNRAHVYGHQFLGAPSLSCGKNRGLIQAIGVGCLTRNVALFMLRLSHLTSQVLLGRNSFRLLHFLVEVVCLSSISFLRSVGGNQA